jgi:calcineurin-like phosphoesterase family protein
MVANINNSVGKDDWLIHLGDWSFGGIESISQFRSLIKCDNIILILGNHDHHIQNDKNDLKKLFTHVAHYEELKVYQGKEKWDFVLCHYPIVSWNGMRKGAFMLHGHQHLKGDARFGEGRRMDIGLCGTEKTGFRPYHIKEVINILNNREEINHH